MNRQPIIYVAHPYGGLKENEDKVASYLLRFIGEYPGCNFFSPIHNFSYAYFDTEYEKGLELCLQFLRYAKELWVCGDWRSSKGCRAEVEFAASHHIPVKYIQ